MVDKIYFLFKTLNKKQRRRFFSLQTLVISMALCEILGVASIVPFMTLVGDISMIHQHTVLSKIYKFTGLGSELEFISLLGIFVLFMLTISAFVSIITTWKISLFANITGTEIADRLYNYYLNQNWLFHTKVSSAQLSKNIAIESSRITNGILAPLMQINAKIILAMLMIFSISIYNYKIALVGVIIFGISYLFLFKFVRSKIELNGRLISIMNEKRFYLMNDGFGGIRDVLLLNVKKYFTEKFFSSGKILATSQGANMALAFVPRYFMELITFGSMILLVLYLINYFEGNLGIILPVTSVYILAGFKLLPAFQQIYSNLAKIKGNIAALDTLNKDLKHSMSINENKTFKNLKTIKFTKKIEFKNVTFAYPNKLNKAIDNINITIHKNSRVGIVGQSGAGKSTLINILLGLVRQQKGNLELDGYTLNENDLSDYQKIIGYVPQHIFLSDNSICENIAFGIPKENIDHDKAINALKMANLLDFVESLEYGIDTQVGERGVQLSGGQIQRIGIARALYNEKEILVFDEATSSLDNISEKLIIEEINKLSKKKTIIIVTHRLKAVEDCDKIFFIHDGKVIDQGSYNDLYKKNEMFKKMVLK